MARGTPSPRAAVSKQTLDFERSLVLNRYFLAQLGAVEFDDLRSRLDRAQEGDFGDGNSFFFHALATAGLKDPAMRAKLADYDRRILAEERELARGRGVFRFKYFQWLALLFTELYLDALTDQPAALRRKLNEFFLKEKARGALPGTMTEFTEEDLRRIAFFMATGSGKTLLLHAHIRQLRHYLAHGAHPEMLANRADGRREWDNILLVTPNEGLSEQHVRELRESGVECGRLVEERSTGGGRGLFGPKVMVVEIHKLADEASGDGVSIALTELGGHNLVFVDEGHKGVGSDAQTWKNRQKALSEGGFLVEYSATFAQAVGAASGGKREALMSDYGKSILFDYSYRYFHGDGHGKDFEVLNLSAGTEERAQELLVGGLLVFYQQFRLFRSHGREFRPYEIARPLWVMLGSSVSRRQGGKADNSTGAKSERADVAKVVTFLQRFLEDPKWATGVIGDVLAGNSGFQDEDTKADLFTQRLEYLRTAKAKQLYADITEQVFHGAGGLELWHLVGDTGEIGLRVSAPTGKEKPYFAVINIGDVSSFEKHVKEHLNLEVKADKLTRSLFDTIEAADSPVHLLIGAKKFIEGWSSWRVSAMALLNMGSGEGSQVIQLFGRGVRLRGKNRSLKRSARLPNEGPHPPELTPLETLYIFGWNANYVQRFREMLQRERVFRELTVTSENLFPKEKTLPIPLPRKNFDVRMETFVVAAEDLGVSIDLMPRVQTLAGTHIGAGTLGESEKVDFTMPAALGLVDASALYDSLLAHKRARRLDHFYIPRAILPDILGRCEVRVSARDRNDPATVHDAATCACKAYLDRFAARRERERESKEIAPAKLAVKDQPVTFRVRTTSDELLKEMEGLVKKGMTELQKTDWRKPLPRLHIERHLYSPLLRDPKDKAYAVADLAVSPPGLSKNESELLERLSGFWETGRNKDPFIGVEVFLLRNQAKTGVGFFKQSGFYPDFLLWLRHKTSGHVHLRFLESHGMHHGGLFLKNSPKIECLKELEAISGRKDFQKAKFSMDGYILTTTPRNDIPGAEGKSWDELTRDYRVMEQATTNVYPLLEMPKAQ